MSEVPQIFDRRLVRRRRERAAPMLADHDFLLREVAGRLVDRLDDIRGRRFPLALDLGCHGGTLGSALGGHGGIDTLVNSDISPKMARLAGGPAVAADEEALPFAEGCFDAVLSCLSLHWVNDLPGTLAQVRRCLKPDGLFLAAMFGGETLHELRQCLAAAEIARDGGLSPRVSPFADVRDAGNLLTRAGLALPVVDADTITVSYGDPLRLLADLRGMGETNAVAERRRQPLTRATLFDALKRYVETFGDSRGRVPATFQVLYLIGWAPGPGQPEALKPGSAEHSLAEALAAPPPDPKGS